MIVTNTKLRILWDKWISSREPHKFKDYLKERVIYYMKKLLLKVM